MSHDEVLELLRRDMTPESYSEIRDLWKAHSIAEDNRDIPGLMATLTPDCVYELPQTGHRWEGHEGATQFYAGLLGAFPDIDFALTNIVIGPQGVWEEAEATGTHTADWLDLPATGKPVRFTVTIFFPWDSDRRKFGGERVYLYGADAPTPSLTDSGD
ncbi:MAG: nuclear transport factor 2 family protein [Gemmatimonadetes bacterium]|nr:nuclear transport factor 2 family protein [Gemmatimonadota bacterium]